MNPKEKLLQFEACAEVMKLPEINVCEERGVTLLSILLKGYNSDWGGNDHQLSGEVENFFKQNPLDERFIKFFQKIKALEDGGVDEEMLYNIALTYEHPEREEGLFDFIHKHKDYSKDCEKLQSELITLLKQLEDVLPNELLTQFKKETDKDIEKTKSNNSRNSRKNEKCN